MTSTRLRWRETDPRRAAESFLLRWWGPEVFRKEKLLGRLQRNRRQEWGEPGTVEEFDMLWDEED